MINRIKKGVLPTWNMQITIFHARFDRVSKTTVWNKQVIGNCYFVTKAVEHLEGNTLSRADKFVARISGGEIFDIETGDIVFKGAIVEDIEVNDDGKKLMKKYPDSFIVRDCKINNTGILNHYHLEGV